MSFDPTSIISIIQNCKALYEYAADVKHSSAERGRLLDEVHSLQPQLEALQKLANTPGVAGDHASMERLAQLLDSSQPFAQVVNDTIGRVKDVLTFGTCNSEANRFKVFGKRGAAALWWTVNKAEVKDLLSDLERYKSRIGLALQHDMFKKQDVMDEKLDNMERHVSNEVRLKIAEFISPHDYTSDCKHLLERKLFGTGTWMLNHPTFVVWHDERESSNRTLWCYGHPGAGKSIMAALIIEHLQSKPNSIVLSVFCRYSSNIFTTSFAVLGGLLRQLIEKTTMVPRAICDLYWSKTDLNPDSLTGFLDEIAASHRRPIYIVVDALDECPFGSDLLRALQYLHTSFRVVVTSRPVFAEIKDYPSVEIRASDNDILLAVDVTLPKLKGAWLDDALKSTIRAKVVEKANGMFLLAALQLRELERDVTCRRDVVDILDSLPRTLDDAYRLTFQRIREQGTRKNELACRALALVALRAPFFYIESVQHVLAAGDATQYTDLETILHCCHGLARCKPGLEIEFIHYSVHEYTTSHWSELFPEHPNRSDFCLQLGFSVLTSPVDKSGKNIFCWDTVVRDMEAPDELKRVITLLKTPEARAALVEDYPELATFVHDPLLMACQGGYWNVVRYMIGSAPMDVQRFNEVLRICRGKQKGGYGEQCVVWINERVDVWVNGDGVVVERG